MPVDQPDWTQSVQLVESGGGTPVPYTAGGILSTTQWGAAGCTTTASESLPALPNDGAQHYLTYMNLEVHVQALVVSGGAVEVDFNMSDSFTNIVILKVNFYVNGVPSSGLMPMATQSTTWPGGYKITQQSVSTGQLKFNLAINNPFGATLTSWTICAQANYGGI